MQLVKSVTEIFPGQPDSNSHTSALFCVGFALLFRYQLVVINIAGDRNAEPCSCKNMYCWDTCTEKCATLRLCIINRFQAICWASQFSCCVSGAKIIAFLFNCIYPASEFNWGELLQQRPALCCVNYSQKDFKTQLLLQRLFFLHTNKQNACYSPFLRQGTGSQPAFCLKVEYISPPAWVQQEQMLGVVNPVRMFWTLTTFWKGRWREGPGCHLLEVSSVATECLQQHKVKSCRG